MNLKDASDTDIPHRLNKGIKLRDITTGCDFTVENDEEPEVTMTDSEKTFGYEKLKPYCLLDALEVGDDFTSGPFEPLKEKMTSVHPQNMIFKEVIRNGTGNIVSINDIVYFHYAFYIEYSEYPFDVSYLRREKPLRVEIGKSGMIVGVDAALRTMKNGEMSKFVIDSSLAFGKNGCPPRIPENATILARMEIFDVIHSDEIKTDDDDSDGRLTIHKALNIATKFNNEAKLFFKYNNIKAAIVEYNKAVQKLLDARLINDQEDESVNELLCKLYSNLAVCHNKLKSYKKVCVTANDAFRDCHELASKNIKLLYHNAYALRMLGEYQMAIKRLKEAAILNPTNKNILNEMKQLNEKAETYKNHEKQIYSKMFGIKKDENISSIEEDEFLSKKKEAWKQDLKLFIDSDELFVSIPCDCREETSVIRKLCSQLNLNCVVKSTSNTIKISKINQN